MFVAVEEEKKTMLVEIEADKKPVTDGLAALEAERGRRKT